MIVLHHPDPNHDTLFSTAWDQFGRPYLTPESFPREPTMITPFDSRTLQRANEHLEEAHTQLDQLADRIWRRTQTEDRTPLDAYIAGIITGVANDTQHARAQIDRLQKTFSELRQHTHHPEHGTIDTDVTTHIPITPKPPGQP